jgi:hypothetical protein
MFQCFDESLNVYLGKCLEIIALFDDFTVQHVSRDENIVMNDLALSSMILVCNMFPEMKI